MDNTGWNVLKVDENEYDKATVKVAVVLLERLKM